VVLTGRGAGGCALARWLRAGPGPARRASAGASSQGRWVEQPPRLCGVHQDACPCGDVSYVSWLLRPEAAPGCRATC